MSFLRNRKLFFGALWLWLTEVSALGVADSRLGNMNEGTFAAALLIGVTLVGVICVIAFVIWYRKGGSQERISARGALQIEDSLDLGLLTKVVLLKTGNRTFLLKVSPLNVGLLQCFGGGKKIDSVSRFDLGFPAESGEDFHPFGQDELGDMSLLATANRETGVLESEMRRNSAGRQNYEKNLEHVKNLTDTNARLVAQTLRNWIEDA